MPIEQQKVEQEPLKETLLPQEPVLAQQQELLVEAKGKPVPSPPRKTLPRKTLLRPVVIQQEKVEQEPLEQLPVQQQQEERPLVQEPFEQKLGWD